MELAKSAAELDEYSGASKPPRSLISRTEAERVLEENRSAMVLLSFETDERRRLCDLPEFALHECKLAGDRVRTHWKNWISKGLTYDERENIGELRRVCKHSESKYNRLKKFNRERVKHIREDEEISQTHDHGHTRQDTGNTDKRKICNESLHACENGGLRGRSEPTFLSFRTSSVEGNLDCRQHQGRGAIQGGGNCFLIWRLLRPRNIY